MGSSGGDNKNNNKQLQSKSHKKCHCVRVCVYVCAIPKLLSRSREYFILFDFLFSHIESLIHGVNTSSLPVSIYIKHICIYISVEVIVIAVSIINCVFGGSALPSFLFICLFIFIGVYDTYEMCECVLVHHSVCECFVFCFQFNTVC